MPIQRNHPKPLYTQLTEIIKERIKFGIYPVKSKLPSEREICEEFGVSRTTVRQTIQQLRQEGFLDVQAARGAFVQAPRQDISVVVSINGFSNDLKKAGKQPSSKLLGLELINDPEGDLIDEMSLNPGDELIKIERLRLASDIPLAIHTVWLNHRLCPQILQHNLTESSLFSLLRDVYHLEISKATQTIYASLADSRERNLLALPEPAAVLQEYRHTFLDSGEIIEYSQATYCGDFYHLLINLDTKVNEI